MQIAKSSKQYIILMPSNPVHKTVEGHNLNCGREIHLEGT